MASVGDRISFPMGSITIIYEITGVDDGGIHSMKVVDIVRHHNRPTMMIHGKEVEVSTALVTVEVTYYSDIVSTDDLEWEFLSDIAGPYFRFRKISEYRKED